MPAHLVLRASCPPYGEGMTYYALRELVAGAGLGLDDVQAFTAAVTEQVGDPDGRTVAQTLGRAFGMVEGVSTPEDIGWATRRLLQGLAQWGPVVVVVDDVQWAEPALVELLLAVADRQAGPVRLVCLARPELLEQHPEAGGAAAGSVGRR